MSNDPFTSTPPPGRRTMITGRGVVGFCPVFYKQFKQFEFILKDPSLIHTHFLLEWMVHH